MKIIFLGQAGFYIEAGNKKILIDPYLSDSVAKIQPQNKRRQPIDVAYLFVKPDFLVITHNHGDHYDKETLSHYLSEKSEITVLSPFSVWQDIKAYGGKNNFILVSSGTIRTEGNIKFTAVKAEHSDPYAIGIILEYENTKYYFTGDTLYNENIFSQLPEDIYAVFLPINGKGNNMNMADAAAFAKRIKAEKVIPVHFGMFDNMSPEEFDCRNKVIPEIYKEIKI